MLIGTRHRCTLKDVVHHIFVEATIEIIWQQCLRSRFSVSLACKWIFYLFVSDSGSVTKFVFTGFFYKQRQVKIGKKQAKAKQHHAAELLLIEN